MTLNKFYEDLEIIDEENKAQSCIRLCIKRLVDTLEHPDLNLSLIKMISLLDEKNITADIFTSLAEVVVVETQVRVSYSW